jgi:two-component system chemotaxis sensor kinase CheA
VSENGTGSEVDVSDEFIRENRQHVRTLVESLMGMGETPDRERVDAAFRAAHSLKANCELAGLDDAATVGHAVEDVLAAVRAGRAEMDEATAGTAMDAVEAIEAVVDGATGDTPPPSLDTEAWAEQLRAPLDDGADGSDGPAADESDGAATHGTDDAATGGDTDGDPAAAAGRGDAADTHPEPSLDDLGLDGDAQAAFEAAGEYDDLDALVAEMDDDAEEFADLEGGGSFDRVEAESETGSTAADGHVEATGGTPNGDANPGVSAAPSAADGEAADGPGAADATSQLDSTDATDDGTAGDEGAEGAPASVGDAPQGGVGAERGVDAPESTATESEEDDTPDPDMAPLTGQAPAAAARSTDPTDGVAVPGAGKVTGAAATLAASSADAARFDAGSEKGRAATSGSDRATALEGTRSLAVERRRLAAALEDLDVEDEQAREALRSLEAATDTAVDAAAADLRRLEGLVADAERAADRAVRQVETPVALETAVAPVAVDRAVVDRLGDPLVHCVRNAIDHGIEPPGDRWAASKPETGTVAVRAERVGDRLVVSVTDDGRGVDADAVREAARDAGLPVADQDDDAVLDLLFEAGLSTADPDSDLSGRGVGMDVVGQAMDALDGEVRVDSTPGEGTTVQLSVPVDGVVERVRLVAVGPESYALPAGAVAEVVPAAEADVRDGVVRVAEGVERDAMGAATAFGSTRDYPIRDPAAALGAPEQAGDAGAGTDTGADTTDGDPAYLLVDPDAGTEGGSDDGDEAAEAGARFALRCVVLAEHETLVTPLRGVDAAPAVDGVVVRDAGRVVPLLDPAAFSGP